MALANYFSKNLLALNQILNSNRQLFEDRLNNTLVKILFEANAIKTREGQIGLELITRLLARLYPRLTFQSSDAEYVAFLERLALNINKNIDLDDGEAEITIIVNVGEVSDYVETSASVFNFGSDNWIANFSPQNIQRFGNSKNPTGASMAACFAAANVFRKVFEMELGKWSQPDKEFFFSTYSLKVGDNTNPNVGPVEFKDVVLAGVGAIGNGALWIFSKFPELSGELIIVDDEKIEETNLQRYILVEESEIIHKKVNIGTKFMDSDYNDLICREFEETWETYIAQRENKVNRVAVGIDSAEGRIHIQSSLPGKIFNAFTEPENVGISRHFDFATEACLACSYIPTEGEIKIHYHQEIATNFGIPDQENLIKDYLNSRSPANSRISPHSPSLLEVLQLRHRIEPVKLEKFKDLPVDKLYSELVCGGIILELADIEGPVQHLDAPLAFQSAMAGILLAVDVIKDVSGYRFQTQRVDIYPLAPIVSEQNPFHRDLDKDRTGRCICVDTDFVNQYYKVWGKESSK